jgi:branched-subunit amino acid ABC-type transport system permease component
VYSLFIIGAGLLLFALLELMLQKLWFGKIMRAVALDPWMAGTLGVNVPAVLTLSVIASFVIAGLAGGLLLANQSLSITVGASFLLYSFFAVIIGGLGSIRGTFVACIILGIVESANATFLPEYGGIAMYVVLAAFLILRPTGLFPARGVA